MKDSKMKEKRKKRGKRKYKENNKGLRVADNAMCVKKEWLACSIVSIFFSKVELLAGFSFLIVRILCF